MFQDIEQDDGVNAIAGKRTLNEVKLKQGQIGHAGSERIQGPAHVVRADEECLRIRDSQIPQQKPGRAADLQDNGRRRSDEFLELPDRLSARGAVNEVVFACGLLMKCCQLVGPVRMLNVISQDAV
jgi:hypothetical protein